MSIPIPVKVLAVFKTGSQAAVIHLPFYCCPGRSRTSKLRIQSAVTLPICLQGNKWLPICQRTFSFEVSIRFELMTPGYKAGVLPTILKDQYVGKNKNPDLANPGFQLFCFLFYNSIISFIPGLFMRGCLTSIILNEKPHAVLPIVLYD